MGLSLVVVLRANVVLDSDADLAARELVALTRRVPARLDRIEPAITECLQSGPVDDPSELLGRTVPQRTGRPRGFRLENVEPEAFDRVIRRAAFAQEIFASPGDHQVVEALVRPLGRGFVGVALPAVLEALDGMIPWLRRHPDKSTAVGAIVEYLLGAGASFGVVPSAMDKALARRGTLHLAHNLHVYKAKFFPRFVAALLNIYGPEDGGTLVEPFAGSGTALFEAAIRGVSSVGFDIDPISAMVSASKVAPLTSDPSHLEAVAATVVGRMDTGPMRGERLQVRLPEPIRGRLVAKDGRDDTSFVNEIEEDAGLIQYAIEPFKGRDRLLLNTLFSDALTKKVRYRFVGVGNGRYTFALTKEPVATRFRKKLLDVSLMASILEWVSEHVRPLAESTAQVGDARDLPVTSGTADVIITSPPYLPASSGREHYALARAIPLALVGIGSPAELEALEAKALGAVPQCDCPPDPILHAALEHLLDCPLAQPSSVADEDLPALGGALLSFLAADPQRRLKYRPTLEYLGALSDSTREALRVLRPGGRLVIVLPRESVFYESQTRKIVFVCPTADMVAQIGEAIGFEVEDRIDMELLKLGTPNARPRSSDAYYERAIVLRVPAAGGIAGLENDLTQAA